MNLHIDPTELAPLIEAAVNAGVRRLGSTRLTDAEAAIPFVKIDGKVLFRPSALEEWAIARESRGGAA